MKKVKKSLFDNSSVAPDVRFYLTTVMCTTFQSLQIYDFHDKLKTTKSFITAPLRNILTFLDGEAPLIAPLVCVPFYPLVC